MLHRKWSKDRTPQVLREVADEDERRLVITLSPNFGHRAALTAVSTTRAATSW